MPVDYTTLPHSGIQKLHPYVPGKAVDSLNEQGITNAIKLASNENPLGCSSEVIQALAKLKSHDLAIYPITRENPLRSFLSEHLALDSPDSILLSNGSDIIFHLLLECFALHTGKHVLTHEYAFITYEVQANTLGIPIRKVPVKPNWQVDIDAILETCTEKTALIFLANPNNPTGLIIPPENVERLLNNIPESTLLVLDEAYYEYTPTNMRSNPKVLLDKYPNLVITRTFSKVYGLAAMRLGYALANPPIIALLNRIQLPFTVSMLSMRAGIAALHDQTFVQESVTVNQEGLVQIIQGLDQLQLTHLPTACNFITFDCKQSAIEVDNRLQVRGIITRPLNPYGLTQHLRVTIGTFEQNERFLNALPLCLKETSA